MAKGQFTYKSKDGRSFDLTPYMEFKNGAYESPTRAYPRIIKQHFPELWDEYSEYIAKRMERMTRLTKLIR